MEFLTGFVRTLGEVYGVIMGISRLKKELTCVELDSATLFLLKFPVLSHKMKTLFNDKYGIINIKRSFY